MLEELSPVIALSIEIRTENDYNKFLPKTWPGKSFLICVILASFRTLSVVKITTFSYINARRMFHATYGFYNALNDLLDSFRGLGPWNRDIFHIITITNL
jgi:hypothetical protein